MHNQLMSKQLLTLATAVVFCQIVGCAVRPRLEGAAEPQAAGDEYIAETTLPAPFDEDQEYTLGFGDVVKIKFFNNEEFDEEVTVRPDGRISLQRVGDIEVSGMTPMALTEIITGKYAEIIRDPEVTVIVSEFGGNTVYILGEVESPGSYPLQRNMTLIRSLAVAGGPTDEANLGSVILIRMVDRDRLSARRIDLNLAMLQKYPALDLEMRSYDIVYVPKTFVANIRAFVTQLYDTVLPPLDLYARSIFWSRMWK